MADKDADPKVADPKVAVEQQKAPPVRWNQTVNSGWYITNEMFRRTARTGEFSPTKEEISPTKKPAEPKAAPSA